MKITDDDIISKKQFVWVSGTARAWMTAEALERELAGTASADDYPRVTVLERRGWGTDGKGRMVKRAGSPNANVAVVGAVGHTHAVARVQDLHDPVGFVPPPARTKLDRVDITSTKRAAAENLAARLFATTGLPFAAVFTAGEWFVQVNPRSPACVKYRNDLPAVSA